jgi:hypothetical protein
MTGDQLTLRIVKGGDGEVIAGSVRDGAGKEHHFTGWLGLLTLLEEARRGVAGHEPSASSDDQTRREKSK